MASEASLATSTSSPSTTRTLTAQCFCKAVHFTITVPIASLPLGVHLCHCSVCRLTHGSYTCFHAPLPAGVSPKFIAPSSLKESTTGYRHATAMATRYFCKTCGAHIGDDDFDAETQTTPENAEWRVSSSLFDAGLHDDGSPGQAFSLRTHAMTDSAPSGFHEWLPRLGDRALSTWNPQPGDAFYPPDTAKPYSPTAPEYDDQGREVLRAACHCGGTSFKITRPADTPNLDEIAKTSGLRLSSEFSDRWIGCLDACDDCRLVDGAHVVGWVELPIAAFGPPVPLDFKVGTLTPHVSSDKALRAFCGVCGATALFRRTDRGDSLTIDLAGGLLRAPEGVSAHKWVHWRDGRVIYLPSAERYHADFAKSLKDGFAAWAAKTYGIENKVGEKAES